MNVKEALGEEAIEDFEDSNFEVPQVTHQTKQTWVEMYHFASELNRYHVGERAGAALWNAAIKDLEEASVIIKEKDTTNITENLTVDRFKCCSEMKNVGSQAKEEKERKRNV